MTTFITNTIVFVFTICLCFCLHSCTAAPDNITTGDSIKESLTETLVSSGSKFELGFFRPRGDSRYVGIWYKEDPKTIVWVANRSNPLPPSPSGSTGVILLAEDGNFNVLDKENGTPYFSTGLEYSSSSFPRTLKLFDTGNLVLLGGSDSESRILWQSFEDPTDTFLPGMKMDGTLTLTSWKSKNDPGKGDFTFREDTEGQNQYIIFKETTTPYWKSGKLSADSFNPSRMSSLATALLTNYSMPNITRHWNITQLELGYRRLVMDSSGEIRYWNRQMFYKQWSLPWFEPKDNCSIYNACGIYGVCNVSGNMCECLQGFEPNNPENWNSGDYSSGCRRMDDLCGDHRIMFLNLPTMQVGESNSQFFYLESEQCQEKCREKCQCQAYSYISGNNESLIGGRPGGHNRCWIWQSDSELADLRVGYAQSGRNLTLKIVVNNGMNATGDPQKPEGNPLKPLVTFAITGLAILLFCSISYIGYWRIITARKESNRRNQELQLPDNVTRRMDLLDRHALREDDTKSFDVPFFDLESILAATDDFSEANKLGQGGFGPVYKGKLPGGQEIAVKRLSSDSGQGLEEFRNEVLLIAKLQHRNLVRLLGYSVKREEKMLLYEYMPNKSLDNFIFDRTLCMLLDWTKRFDIIFGIARGLLYLHQDSRLRIIHRDLKTSNILLDEEMNPKISDFGLARIVGGRETEASTKKVIGTYGYMSPEYALDGLFSIKSDVFSFGVVLLEIISGKRNTGFYQSQIALNLLGYAWSLWNEDKALDLMDQAIAQLCNPSEVLKCINVGLLCVQEDPADRPTMSTVVFMLGSDISSLPNPKQPAFVARRRISGSPSTSSSKQDTQTNNELTISAAEGR